MDLALHLARVRVRARVRVWVRFRASVRPRARARVRARVRARARVRVSTSARSSALIDSALADALPPSDSVEALLLRLTSAWLASAWSAALRRLADSMLTCRVPVGLRSSERSHGPRPLPSALPSALLFAKAFLLAAAMSSAAGVDLVRASVALRAAAFMLVRVPRVRYEREQGVARGLPRHYEEPKYATHLHGLVRSREVVWCSHPRIVLA